MDSQIIRKAAKAGSWYEKNEKKLDSELQGYLNEAEISLNQDKNKQMKAIIGPHAGFTYSGPNAAWAYKNINPKDFDRVVLLGPSHSLPFQTIGLTSCTQWETPLGNLEIDTETNQQLYEQNQNYFIILKKKDEEKEHSLEMHTPYIQKIFKDAGQKVKLLPMMIGQLKEKDLPKYGQILEGLFKDKRTIFIISSDFCHWGEDFDYQPVYKNFKTPQEIWKSIKALDHEGIKEIENQDLAGFQNYLKETENTICGERPIQLLLACIQQVNKEKCETKFVRYDQSSQVTSFEDSSVSYASSYTTYSYI